VKIITTSYSLFQIYFHKTTQSRLSAVATAQAGNHATRFSRQVDWGLEMPDIVTDVQVD